MVEVHLWSGLRALADGKSSVEVEGGTVAQMLMALGKAYPGLADQLEDGVSVSINGTIFVGDQTVEIPQGAEVWILKRLRGG